MKEQINKLDYHQCKEIRKAANAAIQPLANRLGLDIHLGSGTYDDFEFSVKLKIKIKGDAAERGKFERYCAMFDLKPENYGSEFESGGCLFKLIGIKPNRPKYPIQARNLKNGKIYKMPQSQIAHLQRKIPRTVITTKFVPRPAGFTGKCTS